MKIKRSYLVVGAVVVVLVAAAVARIVTRHSVSRSRHQSIPIVQMQPPVRDTVFYTLNLTGDVVSMHEANVVAKVGGTLEKEYVEIGQGVSEGQSLAEIDPTELTQQAQQAAANYVAAKSEYDRQKQLLEQKLIAQQDFDNSEQAMKVADAAYQIAQTQLGYAHVTAPFAGTVTGRFLDPGAIVAANGSTLFTLMDLDDVKVVVDVPEVNVPQVAVGTEAMVFADALPGDTFSGRIGRMSEAVDPATRTMPVEIFVSNSHRQLKPGMYATAQLVLSVHPDAVMVPSQAVLKDAEGQCVYCVVADTARRVKIEAGVEQNGLTEIVSGLTGTENVITTGQQFVKDGGPVSTGQKTVSPSPNSR